MNEALGDVMYGPVLKKKRSTPQGQAVTSQRIAILKRRCASAQPIEARREGRSWFSSRNNSTRVIFGNLAMEKESNRSKNDSLNATNDNFVATKS